MPLDVSLHPFIGLFPKAQPAKLGTATAFSVSCKIS